jgi:hypothetical protein
MNALLGRFSRYARYLVCGSLALVAGSEARYVQASSPSPVELKGLRKVALNVEISPESPDSTALVARVLDKGAHALRQSAALDVDPDAEQQLVVDAAMFPDRHLDSSLQVLRVAIQLRERAILKRKSHRGGSEVTAVTWSQESLLVVRSDEAYAKAEAEMVALIEFFASACKFANAQ